MRYKKKILVVSILVITALCLYVLFQDKFPPRTPHKIARIVSGLNIKNSFNVIEFRDDLHGDWAYSPSGELLIVFSLDFDQLEFLRKECEQNKYQNLPIKNFLYTPDFAKEAGKGLYKLNKVGLDPLDYSLVVLSFTKKKLYVYVSDS
tara:strand:- start:73 stop:516 length:444 start_codon:yes stop_codon:yes gene_type:complete